MHANSSRYPELTNDLHRDNGRSLPLHLRVFWDTAESHPVEQLSVRKPPQHNSVHVEINNRQKTFIRYIRRPRLAQPGYTISSPNPPDVGTVRISPGCQPLSSFLVIS